MIKVLLVEDDPMVAELNRLYVDRVGGFETVAAVRDGASALEILQSRPVDLILLDIFMPGPSGLELLSAVRGSNLDVDVILVTAARDTKTISRALKLGAVDYLIKPFEFERMKQALEHYRETHRRMREPQPASQEELDRVFARPPPAARPCPRGWTGCAWKSSGKPSRTGNTRPGTSPARTWRCGSASPGYPSGNTWNSCAASRSCGWNPATAPSAGRPTATACKRPTWRRCAASSDPRAILKVPAFFSLKTEK